MRHSWFASRSCTPSLLAALLAFLYVLPLAAQTQTAAPIIRPLGGFYRNPQIVRISDATPGAVIYYTTDGTTPTTDSARYTAPLSVTPRLFPYNDDSTLTDTTVQALAVAPGKSASLSKASYSLFPYYLLHSEEGFPSPPGLQLNGNASGGIGGEPINLTPATDPDRRGSVFSVSPVDVSAFTTTFTFTVGNNGGVGADGMMFVIQNSPAGDRALGLSGGSLGYSGITNSVGIKFDAHNNSGEGDSSTGLYINGAAPTIPAVDLTPSGINLHSENLTMAVTLTYDGTTLHMTLTDTVTKKTFDQSWTVNIPKVIGSSMAYVGFTGGTGTFYLSSGHNVVNWTYGSWKATNFGAGFPAEAAIQTNGSSQIANHTLQLDDGNADEVASAFATTPVKVDTFTTTFTFSTQAGPAEGIMFVIQNAPAATNALGSGGASLGYAGMRNSVGIKFSLYNNGELDSSTDLYINGRPPTAPAVSMKAAGIDLHSGHPMEVTLGFAGATLNMTLTDTITKAVFYTAWTVSIPQIIGCDLAYVGFTAATNSLPTANMGRDQVLSWTYAPLELNFANGFWAASDFIDAHGHTQLVDNTLMLTDGGNLEASAVWLGGVAPFPYAPLPNFTSQFTFQMTDAQADGLVFVLQHGAGDGLGLSGGSLGYYPDSSPSVGIKFDLHDNYGEGNNSTGLYINGAFPGTPARDMTASGINLHSGHPMNVTLSYINPTLSMTVDDPIANAEYSTSWTVDIYPILCAGEPPPSRDVPDPCGYRFGFTAGTGALAATIRILNFGFHHALQ